MRRDFRNGLGIDTRSDDLDLFYRVREKLIQASLPAEQTLDELDELNQRRARRRSSTG